MVDFCGKRAFKRKEFLKHEKQYEIFSSWTVASLYLYDRYYDDQGKHLKSAADRGGICAGADPVRCEQGRRRTLQ